MHRGLKQKSDKIVHEVYTLCFWYLITSQLNFKQKKFRPKQIHEMIFLEDFIEYADMHELTGDR